MRGMGYRVVDMLVDRLTALDTRTLAFRLSSPS
jgi:hypothetical protein